LVSLAEARSAGFDGWQNVEVRVAGVRRVADQPFEVDGRDEAGHSHRGFRVEARCPEAFLAERARVHNTTGGDYRGGRGCRGKGGNKGGNGYRRYKRYRRYIRYTCFDFSGLPRAVTLDALAGFLPAAVQLVLVKP
jgi:hypothetical protein